MLYVCIPQKQRYLLITDQISSLVLLNYSLIVILQSVLFN